MEQPFHSVPGGLCLATTGLELIVDAEAAGLLEPRDPLATHARAQGRAAIFLGFGPDDEILVDGAIPGDGPQGFIRFAAWRPWIDPVGEGLWLEPRHLGERRVLHICCNGLVWHHSLPASDPLHLLSGRDMVMSGTARIRDAWGLDL
jgi:hypothetical protein